MKKKEPPDPEVLLTEFLRKTYEFDSEIYVGIDPGVGGAIGLLCNRVYTVFDIPVIKTKVKKIKQTNTKERLATGHKTKTVMGYSTKFNFPVICRLFNLLRPRKANIIIILEEVPLSLGPGKKYAEIVLNRAYAMWPLFLYSKGHTLEEIRPNVWKQKMGLPGKNKEASRQKALRLFPNADILRKEDHDRAEALLMCEYVRKLRLSEAKI